MSDQFYMTRLVFNEDDGERLMLFQQATKNQGNAEKNAQRLGRKAVRIIETVETSVEAFEAAYKANEAKYPGRASTQELTGGVGTRLLKSPDLAEKDG